ncbi:hypothetical protein EYF80_045608 [Liparis tanakae]|uniref:Uncharacterized protein n=1 Tax=Liparis tanakae TaxID=230148 RepID=A0A4Z2FT48_9TELE|nr:hypothetical protein EYF80_045608 [Liparis tanakae]
MLDCGGGPLAQARFIHEVIAHRWSGFDLHLKVGSGLGFGSVLFVPGPHPPPPGPREWFGQQNDVVFGIVASLQT